ncbi:hypothetical protein DY000_02061318 [Brassica cretica]|uniref:LisH domain-containing protein n=1 Tax=Brassica cretica TaxID=69181 RepID=A0ABQ7AQF8_BRACR|nr:hypothetical protein DY000_02061318 [Brassica cretica]
MAKSSRSKGSSNIGNGVITPTQIAFIVDRYLHGNRFSKTRSLFRSEASSLLSNSPVRDVLKSYLTLEDILKDYGHLPRNIPREIFLGIYRGRCSSEYTEGHVPRNIPRKGVPRGDFRQTGAPRNFLGNVFPRNSVGYFRRNSEERRNSEQLFPRTCFVGMSSE